MVNRIKKECHYCGKEFYLRETDIRIKRKQEYFYCSSNCSNESKKTGNIVHCKQCSKKFYTTRNEFCSKQCVIDYKKEHYNHKLYMEKGYLNFYLKDYNKKGNVKLHRAIMELHLGRLLTKDEIVHHIDGNKLNNSIDNLIVMSRGEHSRLHRLKELENGKKLFRSE